MNSTKKQYKAKFMEIHLPEVIVTNEFWIGDPQAIQSLRRPRRSLYDPSKEQSRRLVKKLLIDTQPMCIRNLSISGEQPINKHSKPNQLPPINRGTPLVTPKRTKVPEDLPILPDVYYKTRKSHEARQDASIQHRTFVRKSLNLQHSILQTVQRQILQPIDQIGQDHNKLLRVQQGYKLTLKSKASRNSTCA